MTDAPVPPFTVRYVAGLAAHSTPDGAPEYSVIRLCEADAGGAQIARPTVVLDGLTEAQAEHLWMQLGRALGKTETFPDVLAQIDGAAHWKALRAALDRHREHEGVEVEVHDARRAPDPEPGGWMDVREFLPGAYR